MIQTLSLGHKEAGAYRKKDKAAYWNGRNSNGEEVASGVYFYTMEAGKFKTTRKMVIAR
jgi:flagellar hook assembly protein FlgD